MRDAPVDGVFDSGGSDRAAASCGERLPYLDGAVPSRLGAVSAGLVVLQAVSAARPAAPMLAESESRLRRLGLADPKSSAGSLFPGVFIGSG